MIVFIYKQPKTKTYKPMAEEHPTYQDSTMIGGDDMSVMRVLLQTVRGLSPISSAPALEIALGDE